MPIAPELRHHYRGPQWRRRRAEILERAQHCCERCGKPDRIDVLATANAWFDPVGKRWIRPGDRLIDRRPPIERGVPCARPCSPATVKTSQLGVAHINHRAGDDRNRNLAAWCRECHLIFDRDKHAETRKERKDQKRPLLTGALTTDRECTPPLLPHQKARGKP
jgi:5-methylcytosine-specific restriction endonuclease McrA